MWRLGCVFEVGNCFDYALQDYVLFWPRFVHHLAETWPNSGGLPPPRPPA